MPRCRRGGAARRAGAVVEERHDPRACRPNCRAARFARLRRGVVLAGLLALLAGCSTPDLFSSQPAAPAQPSTAIGTGQVKVALILPLSAGGNAGIAALSMRNAAEMALAEFNSPNIQLLVKDDGGSAGGAQQAAQQALAEGAEIIVGPLFAQSVAAVGQVARSRGVPVIAFSTDVSVAARGVYLLSFLPESDVDRIVDYAVANGKRSFAAMLPDNAYGTRGRGGVQADHRAQGRAHRGAGALSARLDADGRRRRTSSRRRRAAPTRSSFPTAPTRCPSWCRR